jgi:hypothetical protein
MWTAIWIALNTFDQVCRHYFPFLIEQSTWTFLILTVIFGGGAAFIGGRSLALGWKSVGVLAAYMLIFGAGIRFLHFALYQANLAALLYYVSHTAVIIAFALLGYRMTRTRQMTEQYPWMYERTGPLSWRQKA